FLVFILSYCLGLTIYSLLVVLVQLAELSLDSARAGSLGAPPGFPRGGASEGSGGWWGALCRPALRRGVVPRRTRDEQEPSQGVDGSGNSGGVRATARDLARASAPPGRGGSAALAGARRATGQGPGTVAGVVPRGGCPADERIPLPRAGLPAALRGGALRPR